MTTKEFKAIVDDAVANGADRKEAEAYVRSGYKLGGGFGKTKAPATAKAKAPTKGNANRKVRK